MYDNKVRLSQDVLEKAEQIASEWGLKNARAAIEAVFRKYADEYLYGRTSYPTETDTIVPFRQVNPTIDCEALDELDDLLSL
jgi:hypothetical protein